MLYYHVAKNICDVPADTFKKISIDQLKGRKMTIFGVFLSFFVQQSITSKVENIYTKDTLDLYLHILIFLSKLDPNLTRNAKST